MDLKESLRILMCCVTLSLAITALANSIPTITYCGSFGCHYNYGFPYAAFYSVPMEGGIYDGGFIQNIAFWFIVVSVCAYLVKKYDLFKNIKPNIHVKIKSWQIALLSTIPFYPFTSHSFADILILSIMLITAILLRLNKTKPLSAILCIVIGLLSSYFIHHGSGIIMSISLFLASFYYFWKEAPKKEQLLNKA